jgi:hypothetical protein
VDDLGPIATVQRRRLMTDLERDDYQTGYELGRYHTRHIRLSEFEEEFNEFFIAGYWDGLLSLADPS